MGFSCFSFCATLTVKKEVQLYVCLPYVRQLLIHTHTCISSTPYFCIFHSIELVVILFLTLSCNLCKDKSLTLHVNWLQGV